MITLQIDGPQQTGASLCVKATGDANCRIAHVGRNFTIGNRENTQPAIYTLTKELFIDTEGMGILEMTPDLAQPVEDGTDINIYFNAMIDRLVAELVLGWKPICGREDITAWLESCGHKVPPEPHWSRIWVDPALDGYRALSACEECGDMPEFSLDIARAWPIAESGELSLFPLVEGRTIQGKVVGWAAAGGRNTAEAPSAALAICLAALRAVGLPEGAKSA